MSETALEPAADTSADETGGIVERARTAQARWETVTLHERARRLERVRRALLAKAESLAALVHLECGKPEEEVLFGEILPSADLFEHWAAHGEGVLAPRDVELDAFRFPHQSGRSTRVPVGVVLLLTPAFDPIAVAMRTIVPALLAGNAVVLLPSEALPRSADALVGLFADALISDVVTLVHGGPDTRRALIAARPDLVVFTGSEPTGKDVAKECAEGLVALSLELGKKGAAIVLADASIERAARGIVWGAFAGAGQSSASFDRVYVEASIAKAFTERVVATVAALVPKRDLGKIPTETGRSLVAARIAQAVDAGAKILSEGEVTVLDVADESIELLEEETLGPVLAIIPVDSATDAVRRVNRSQRAVSTSIFSADVDRARDLASRLLTSLVTINDPGPATRIASAPWGAASAMGGGARLHVLTRELFVLENASRAKSDLAWYPYDARLRSVGLALSKARGGAGLFGRLASILRLIVDLPRRLFGK